MKKYILILCLSFNLTFSGFSQQRKFFVGGTIGLNSQTSSTSVDETKSKIYDFSILPSAGYFLNERLAIGTSVGFNIGGDKYDAPNFSTSRTTFSINPFIRYNLMEISNITLIGQVATDISFGNSTQKSNGIDNSKSSIFGCNIGVSPGLSYNVNDKFSVIALIGNLGYGYYSNSHNGVKSITNSFHLSLSSELSLGLVYFL